MPDPTPTNTELQRRIAEGLGWTNLENDPSHCGLLRGCPPGAPPGIAILVFHWPSDLAEAWRLLPEDVYVILDRLWDGAQRVHRCRIPPPWPPTICVEGIDPDPARAICLAWLAWQDAQRAAETPPAPAPPSGTGQERTPQEPRP